MISDNETSSIQQQDFSDSHQHQNIRASDASHELEGQVDYDQLFQEARRQQVLRQINQLNNESQDQANHHKEILQILENRAKRQDKKQQYKVKDEMKRLRQQNALEFFRKVKVKLLLHFRQSVEAGLMIDHKSQEIVLRLLSFCGIQELKKYMQLRSKSQMSRKRKDFIALIEGIFKNEKLELGSEKKYENIWSLAKDLGVGFGRISFFDISDLQLQSFYNLKYISTKGKKKVEKQIDILKNKLQRKITQQQLNDKNFVSLDSYSFNPSRLSSKSQPLSYQKTESSILSKFEKIRQMKKTFHHSFCQIYCPVQKNWLLYNMQTLSSEEIQDIKTSILDGIPCIGFYSTRLIQFNRKCQQLKKQRILANVEVRDRTIDFCDKYDLVLKRRHRLGCKNLYKAFIKETNIYKNIAVLSNFDQMIHVQQNKKELQWALQNFPKSVREMRSSDLFVTPSLVEKYLILKQGAQPIPDLQFHEEKVYLKKDLEKVSSRMGWIDCGRMVKQNEIPIKITENKNKTATKLYKYNQTEPFSIKLNQEGEFVLDQQYNSIYVPPIFQIPQGFQMAIENVEYLCKKMKYKCARVVQGFNMAGSYIVANNIGYLVESERKKEILGLFQERQQKLQKKKEQKKVSNAMGLWRKLFKSIIISQQINRQ